MVISATERKRNTAVSNLNQVTDFITSFNIDKCKLTHVQNRLERIEKYASEFEESQSKCEQKILDCESPSEEDLQLETQRRNDFETMYLDVKSDLMDLLVQLKSKSTVNAPSTSTPIKIGEQAFKLPDIKIEPFDGSYKKWFAFRDLFNTLIHNNDQLPDTSKLLYLKSYLVGSAAKICQNLEICEQNYSIAYDLVFKKFDDTKLIIYDYLSDIFNIKVCRKDHCQDLEKLVDTMEGSVRALQSLDVKVQHWDVILVYIVASKLDESSRVVWENVASQLKSPTYKQIIECVENRCKILQKVQHETKSSDKPSHTKSSKSFVAVQAHSCSLCSKDHSISKCDQFLAMAVADRHNIIKQKNLCFNCLANHSIKKCPSRFNCNICKRRHHTLIHFQERVAAPLVEEPVNPLPSTSTFLSKGSRGVNSLQGDKPFKCNAQIILATAKVQVVDAFGNTFVCRAVLDSGSQSCFMSESLCQLLKLRRRRIYQPVVGIGSQVTPIKHQVSARIQSLNSNFQVNLDFLVLPKISSELPRNKVDISKLNIPKGVKLADPEFYRPGKVDLLIGAELYSDIMTGDSISISKDFPVLHATVFGYVVIGRVSQSSCSLMSVSLHTFEDGSKLDKQISKFWELEELGSRQNFSLEEKRCEEHYLKTVRRKADGRYSVSLPIKQNISRLGDSKLNAMFQFNALERRLNVNIALKQQYIEFMDEYLNLNHMELVNESQSTVEPEISYYLPHHAVVKPNSTTTKLRVVFNASSKTRGGISLNETLAVGPTVQQDLISIILRFRKHQVAITADICKMYRQIEIQPSHRDVQRILWRPTNRESIKTYRLCTVTYGTASAPYLATRTLNQLAQDESTKFSLAANRVAKDFYVDDLLSGSDSIENARKLRDDFLELLRAGCFPLRKWNSNRPEVLNDLSSELRDEASTVVSVLGINWHPVEDAFSPCVSNLKFSNCLTKRAVLSEIAQLFDPLGLCGPVIFQAKVFMQNLWTLSIGWSDQLSDELQVLWKEFRRELVQLNEISIPRCVFSPNSNMWEIHGFCDASESGYGACVYTRCTTDHQNFQLKLLCSKSRIAPLKKLTIPRLELCGALLLSELVEKVLHSLEIDVSEVFLWTDSKIVLGYIRSSPARFKTFVANRVSKIQDFTASFRWQHVRSENNPADVLSRGSTPTKLKDCDLWWSGPGFLQKPFKCEEVAKLDQVILPEERQTQIGLNVTLPGDEFQLINKFSVFNKLLRVCAWCLRFANNAKPNSNKQSGPLTADELEQSLKVLVRVVQNQEFKTELKVLQCNKIVSTKSKLKSFNPFIDSFGLIRVGGRLQKASLPFERMHQLLLPANHKLSELIMKSEHLRHLHAAPQALLNITRQTYWIISGKCLAKRVVRECFRCFHTKPKVMEQLIGQLPHPRVNQSSPFVHCGVDFFGPITVKYKVRTKVTTKAYGCIFVCLSTKAVHLETVEELSTNAFLAALRRFISRRGKCSALYSDNATNFVGADRQLHELRKKFLSQSHLKAVQDFCAHESIKWSFIPPRSPHFGGLWEAAVKSAKNHLKRVLLSSAVTIEELTTLLTQIEACLNSRPITALSEDPNDLSALTPGHFLIGRPITAIPEPSVENINLLRLPRWTQLQQMLQHFWRRWSKEYINQMQQSYKWLNRTETVKVGALVLIKEDNLPPTSWALGRILKVYPGEDSLVRVVDVKTIKGELKRAITELCLIPSALQP